MIGFEISKKNNDLSYNLYHMWCHDLFVISKLDKKALKHLENQNDWLWNFKKE